MTLLVLKSCPVKSAGVSSDIKDGGYEILLRLPFEMIGGMPKGGEGMGFDLVLNDQDTGERRDRQMIWSGACGQRTYLKETAHLDGKFGVLQVY